MLLCAAIIFLIAQRVLCAAPVPQLQTFEVEQETLAAFVPTPAPAAGYGLLVFIPPWDEVRLPRGWGPVLARHQMIFVTAAHAGNNASLAGRREHLAMLAAGAMAARFPVDSTRVYVSGFSGGSRIAIRVAIAHPEVFRGALLNAGSDPLGEPDFPLPAPEILARAQESSRIVYVTGENDSVNTDKDTQSAASLRRHCILDTVTEVIPWMGHEVAGPAAFELALGALQGHGTADPEKMRACRARQ